MARAEIVRDHTGNLTLRVSGEPVYGAVVGGVAPAATGGLSVHVNIPVQHVVFREADNVLSFRRGNDANDQPAP